MSRRLLHAARFAACLLVAMFVALLASPTEALAQKKKTEEAPPERGYTLPYTITVVLIGAGVSVLCFPQLRGKGAAVEEEEMQPVAKPKHGH